MKRTLFAVFTLLVIVTFAFGVGRVRGNGSLWTDTFSDSTADGYLDRWDLWRFGDGTTTGSVAVDVGQNRLLMTVTGGNPGSTSTRGWGITLKDSIVNLLRDFVMQVDYQLIRWQQTNPYMRCALGDTSKSENTWFWGQRISENYGASIPHYGTDAMLRGYHGSTSYNPTTIATSGTIRLERSGNSVTAYFLDSGVSVWTTIGYADQWDGIHGNGYLSPQLGFWVWQTGTFPEGGFQVAFSNFIVVSGNVFVIPELPFGPILGVVVCFAVFGVIGVRRLRPQLLAQLRQLT